MTSGSPLWIWDDRHLLRRNWNHRSFTILSSGLQVVSLTSSHPLTLVLIHSTNDEHDISNWIDKTRMLAINVSINHNSLKYLLFTFLIIGEWWCRALWLIGQKFKNSNWQSPSIEWVNTSIELKVGLFICSNPTHTWMIQQLIIS